MQSVLQDDFLVDTSTNFARTVARRLTNGRAVEPIFRKVALNRKAKRPPYARRPFCFSIVGLPADDKPLCLVAG